MHVARFALSVLSFIEMWKGQDHCVASRMAWVRTLFNKTAQSFLPLLVSLEPSPPLCCVEVPGCRPCLGRLGGSSVDHVVRDLDAGVRHHVFVPVFGNFSSHLSNSF
jgi:hypothetical protein